MRNFSIMKFTGAGIRKRDIKKRSRIFMKEAKGKNGLPSQNSSEGLIDKALRLMSVYSQATGCRFCVYDSSCKPYHPDIQEDAASNLKDKDIIEKSICPYCVKFGSSEVSEPYPCHSMHINAIREANRKGGSHIYRCSLGFMFWTSPIYTDGSFSGALRGSGFFDRTQMTVEQSQFDNFIISMCNNEISHEKFRSLIDSFVNADNEKINSLAEMLLLCAEALSSGSEDYHEILRRRTEQQEIISKFINVLKAEYPEGSKPGYPLDKERMLIAALNRGDTDEAKRLLNQLLAALIFSNPGHFKYIQLRATELVVLLSRVEANHGKGSSAAMEANSRSLKRVQESKTIEELTDILHTIVERVTNQIASFRGIPHAVALRKAESFILENFTRKISLHEIASVAGLSAPYFSSIFKEEMGENLSKYLNRLRVEKSSRLLLETDMSLSEIAGACCFEDQSWFSKTFKAYTGISPGKYRNQGGGMVQDISENNLSEDFLKTIK